MEGKHIPVLIDTIIGTLRENDNRFVDATTGLGGYIKAIASSKPRATFLAIDCDPQNLSMAKENLQNIPVVFHAGNFSDMESIIKEHSFENADVYIFDLGLCSTHIDTPSRGFSFSKEGPLDMRFSGEGESAYDFVNFASGKEIEQVLRELGEEKFARYIAEEIIFTRKREKIASTRKLAEIIENAYEKMGRKRGKIHPATKTFQALRIHVNKELEVLKEALDKTIQCMKQGARIYVVSYHSLEDRLVKNIFRNNKKEGILTLINKKVIVPNDEEIRINPRARSAKLRIAEKHA